MAVVGHIQILCNLRAVTIEIVGHIVVLFAEHTPAYEVSAVRARNGHEATVNLVGRALCEAHGGNHREDKGQNGFLHHCCR